VRTRVHPILQCSRKSTGCFSVSQQTHRHIAGPCPVVKASCSILVPEALLFISDKDLELMYHTFGRGNDSKHSPLRYTRQTNVQPFSQALATPCLSSSHRRRRNRCSMLWSPCPVFIRKRQVQGSDSQASTPNRRADSRHLATPSLFRVITKTSYGDCQPSCQRIPPL
jgi:hypothetical protein